MPAELPNAASTRSGPLSLCNFLPPAASNKRFKGSKYLSFAPRVKVGITDDYSGVRDGRRARGEV